MTPHDAPDGPEVPAVPEARSEPSTARVGHRLIGASWAGTAVFAVVSVLSVLSRDLRPAGVAVSLALFAIGCGAFLWAYAIAVDRSRTHNLGIGGLYFLAGTGPRRVQAHLMGSFGAEVVVALAAASIRPFTTLAFGILVPVYGLGLAGLWSARHGVFAERTDVRPTTQRSR